MSVEFRIAQPSDWPTIQRLHAEQNAEQGTNTALPQIFEGKGFARNIALAIMAERDGVPVQVRWYINVPELCFAGMDPVATAAAQRAAEMDAFLLRAMGFTGTNCKVPECVAEHIDGPLTRAGYREDSGLKHYFKDLRLPKKEES